VTVSIRKFQIIVLVSNRIEYWSNYSIPFEISNIRTALVTTGDSNKSHQQTERSMVTSNDILFINRLTALPSVVTRPAILSSRDRSIADYS